MSCLVPMDEPQPREDPPRARLGPPIPRPTRRARTSEAARGTSTTYPSAGLTLLSDGDGITIRVDDHHAGPLTLAWVDLDRLRAQATRHERR